MSAQRHLGRQQTGNVEAGHADHVSIGGHPLPFGDGVMTIGIGPHRATGFGAFAVFGRCLPSGVLSQRTFAQVMTWICRRHGTAPDSVACRTPTRIKIGLPQRRRAADQRLAIPERALSFRANASGAFLPADTGNRSTSSATTTRTGRDASPAGFPLARRSPAATDEDFLPHVLPELRVNGDCTLPVRHCALIIC